MTIEPTFEKFMPLLQPTAPRARPPATFGFWGMICAVTAETYAPCWHRMYFSGGCACMDWWVLCACIVCRLGCMLVNNYLYVLVHTCVCANIRAVLTMDALLGRLRLCVLWVWRHFGKNSIDMGWLRWVGSFKYQVPFTQKPHENRALLQNRRNDKLLGRLR